MKFGANPENLYKKNFLCKNTTKCFKHIKHLLCFIYITTMTDFRKIRTLFKADIFINSNPGLNSIYMSIIKLSKHDYIFAHNVSVSIN